MGPKKSTTILLHLNENNVSRDPIALFINHIVLINIKQSRKWAISETPDWTTRNLNVSFPYIILSLYTFIRLPPSPESFEMQRREKSKEPMKRSLVLSTPFPHFFVLILQRPFSTRRMFPTSMESVDSSAHDPLTVEDRGKWVRNWRNGCRYATSPGTRRPCIIDLLPSHRDKMLFVRVYLRAGIWKFDGFDSKKN